MQNSHVELQQFINCFLGIKAFHTEDVFLFSVTLQKLLSFTPLLPYTHTRRSYTEQHFYCYHLKGLYMLVMLKRDKCQNDISP